MFSTNYILLCERRVNGMFINYLENILIYYIDLGSKLVIVLN